MALKKQILTDIYHKLKSPFGRDETIEKFKREVEEACKDRDNSEINIYDYEKKTDKKVKPNINEINMYKPVEKSVSKVPFFNFLFKKKLFSTQIDALKLELNLFVEEKNVTPNSVEYSIFRGNKMKKFSKIKVQVTN